MPDSPPPPTLNWARVEPAETPGLRGLTTLAVSVVVVAALYLGRLPIPKEAIRGTQKSLLSFAGYNLLFGAAIPGIDNSAHVGGLLAGLVLGAAWALRWRSRWST